MSATVLNYTQIAETLNPIVREELGEEATILQEDLSNIVDIGVEAENAGKVDRILNSLVVKFTRMLFHDKVYRGRDIYGFMKDNIEYGALQRVSLDYLLDAEDNVSYQLEEGMSVDPNVIKNLPKPSSRYFEEVLTKEIDFTELREQYKLVFTSPENLARFTAMCFTVVENSKAFQLEVLQKRLMNATMSEHIYQNRAIDLIALYNTEMGLTGNDRMTIAKAKYSKDFLRFASMTINDYYNAMKNVSTLYNLKGAPAWTDAPQIAMLSKFADLCAFYLESDTFHNQLVSLPDGAFHKVSAWQNEPSRDFTKISQIDLTNAQGHHVQQSNIVGVLYDNEGMMITLDNPRTTSNWNPRGEYYTWFNKYDTKMCTFDNCQMIVFVMNDPT